MTQDQTYWQNRKEEDKQVDWNYDENTWIDGYVHSQEHPHRQLILRALKDFLPIERLLEIGCNAGPNLKLIRESNEEIELHGIDISPVAIERAKVNVPSAFVKLGDYEDLPWGENVFDGVLADAVLLYADPDKFKKVLEEINRVAERFVILVERYAKEDSIVGHVWGRDYKKYFEGYGFDVSETKITEKEWPDSKSWQKFGRIYVARRQ